VLLSLVAVLRLRLDAHRILGALQNRDVRRNLGVRRVHRGRRVPQIHPVPSEWDALVEGLQRIGLECQFRLVRQGSAAPRPEARMPACDRRLVCRAATPFRSPPLAEPEERSTLYTRASARFAASPCGAVRAQRPLRRLWIRQQLCQPSLPLQREQQERVAPRRLARSSLRTLSPHQQRERRRLRLA
jgi:hypothetical protein